MSLAQTGRVRLRRVVRQRQQYDCALACAAMLSGLPYLRVRGYWPITIRGTTATEMVKILNAIDGCRMGSVSAAAVADPLATRPAVVRAGCRRDSTREGP